MSSLYILIQKTPVLKENFFFFIQHNAPGKIHFVHTQKYEKLFDIKDYSMINAIESNRGSETRVLETRYRKSYSFRGDSETRLQPLVNFIP